MKLKPCDCIDQDTAASLNEQGIGDGQNSITVAPGVVILEIRHTSIRIPMSKFKLFATWYLEEQEIPDDRYVSPGAKQKEDYKTTF